MFSQTCPAGNIPVGVGGQAAYAATQGQRKPVDLTIQPNCGTSATASTNTVFIAAAFWAEGAFKIIWQNRSFEAGTIICFVQRHLDEPSEPWFLASSLQKALGLKQEIPWIPASSPQEEQDGRRTVPGYKVCPGPRGGQTQKALAYECQPAGFLDSTRLAVWSQTWRAFVPARILGVAPSATVDREGKPIPAGSINPGLQCPDGSKAFKILTPEQFAAMLQEQPPLSPVILSSLQVREADL